MAVLCGTCRCGPPRSPCRRRPQTTEAASVKSRVVARRTANEQVAQSFESYRWLASVLMGETQGADRAVPVDRYTGNPLALFDAHVTRAIADAVLGHPLELNHHSAAAMRLRSAATALCPTAWAHLLHGLALAEQARAARVDERDDVLAASTR